MSEASADTPQPPAQHSPWSTIAWIASIVLVVVFVAGAWFRLRDENGGEALVAKITSGKRPVAPALPTKGIARDGAPGIGALSATRPRVVNFWASWCAACQAEMPTLERLSARYAGRVDFVGVDAGNEDPLSNARAFVRKYHVTYSIVRGDRASKSAWGVQGYPETFVVGVDGKISYHAFAEVDSDELSAVLDHELEAKRS